MSSLNDYIIIIQGVKSMKVEVKEKFKKIIPKKPSQKAVVLITTLLILVVAGVALFKSKFIQNKFFSNQQVVQRLAAVRKGDIKVAVSGSGPLYYSKTSNLTSKVASTITKLYFKEGDKVKAGDLIAELDDKDALNTVNDKKNSLTQSQLSNSTDDINKLQIKASITGQITELKALKGANISKGGALFTITDTSKLKTSMSFNFSDASQFSLGAEAQVYLTSIMQSVKGYVTYISNSPKTTASGGQLVNVEIEMDNPGALLAGMTASAEVETYRGVASSIDTGTLDYLNKQTITSETGGTVESLAIKEGQKVNAGSLVITLKNDDIVKSNQLNNLKIESSKLQVENAEKQLSNYKIYATIDGTITKQTLNEGDNVKANDVIAVVTDTTQMRFDISIDELDIAKLSLGQKASITIDALTDTAAKPLQGEVVKVPFEGKSQNGVATFAVTIQLNENIETLKSGMNANAEVEINTVSNVLYVPIEAVTKARGKSYVMVKSDGTTGNNGQTSSQAQSGFNRQRPTDGQETAQGGTQGNSGQGGQNAQGGNRQSNGNGGNSNRQNSGNNQNNGNAQNRSNSTAGVNSNNLLRGILGNGQSNNKTQNYYANAVQKEVEVGINNDGYIEIKSGLKEGEQVILPQIQTSQSNQQMTRQATGGNMPTGGSFPGGGNR